MLQRVSSASPFLLSVSGTRPLSCLSQQVAHQLPPRIRRKRRRHTRRMRRTRILLRALLALRPTMDPARSLSIPAATRRLTALTVQARGDTECDNHGPSFLLPPFALLSDPHFPFFPAEECGCIVRGHPPGRKCATAESLAYELSSFLAVSLTINTQLTLTRMRTQVRHLTPKSSSRYPLPCLSASHLPLFLSSAC
ncbi:hypothetical protein DFH06DRAFT_1216306, partial [Mycena polygramma]